MDHLVTLSNPIKSILSVTMVLPIGSACIVLVNGVTYETFLTRVSCGRNCLTFLKAGTSYHNTMSSGLIPSYRFLILVLGLGVTDLAGEVIVTCS